MTTTAPGPGVPRATDETAAETVRAPAPRGFGYKPALDGLRAVAVLSVIAYHYDAKWAQGGFLGVDMFFVLSGYLITSLLLVEYAGASTIRFGAFWARRARRLLPALFVLLLVVALWGRLVLAPDQWGALRLDEIWTLFYGANWHFIASGQSYFVAEPSMLRHAWSLAIEEQFYLVWPLLVFATLRLTRGRHKALTWVCVGGTGFSLYSLVTHYTKGADPSRAYYGTDSRASQLLIGALLAIVLAHWAPRVRASRRALQLLGVGAAVAVGAAFVLARADGIGWSTVLLYRGGFVVFAVATACVIAAVVQPTGSVLGAALSWRPIRWIGQVSYGLYLWHWPARVALSPDRTGLRGGWLTALWIGVTLAATTASYYLVEVPLRHRRFTWKWTPRIALPAAVALTLAVILVATAGATENLLAEPPGTVLHVPKAHVAIPAPVGPAEPTIPTRHAVLLGDSVGFTLGGPLSTQMAKDGVALDVAARSGCGMTTAPALDGTSGLVLPWTTACGDSLLDFVQKVLGEQNPDAVLWSSTWEASDHVVNGKTLHFGTAAYDAWLLAQMDTVRALVVAHGARLVMLTVAPTSPNSHYYPADDATRFVHLDALMYRFAAQHAGDVAVADLAAVVCPSGAPCPTSEDGITLRQDDNLHYLPDGATWVAPRLAPAVYAALRSIDAARARAAASATTTTRSSSPR